MDSIEDLIRRTVEDQKEIEFINNIYQRALDRGINLDYEKFLNDTLDDYNFYVKRLEDSEEAKYCSLYEAFKRTTGSAIDGML